MYTTQIYLPHQMHSQIALLAKQQNQPKAKVIRHLIHKGIEVEVKAQKGSQSAQALLNMAKKAQELNLKGPSDLSTNHDKYLWDE